MNKTQLLSECNPATIEHAATQLINGRLVAFPTETVYGLGADASNSKAVQRIYEVKGRPSDHPLIVHISSINSLELWASEIPEYATKLACDYWPGPMTLVLPRTSQAGDFITGHQDSVALRIPDNPVALALLMSFELKGGFGIAAPSANRFGQVSPTSAQDVLAELGDYLEFGDLILQGVNCDIGIESTIIDCTKAAPRILRPGAVTKIKIQESTGLEELLVPDPSPRVSGLLEKHYAPWAKVILDKVPKKGQGFIALSENLTPEGVLRIAAPASVEEFAQVLYSSLRKADELKLSEVVVIVPVGQNLERAIKDRLMKAAQGR